MARCATLLSIAALGAGGALACGDDPVTPPSVASVAVTSPIGNRLGVGRTVQLGAEARDSRGGTIAGATFTWSSSAPGLASVSATGVVSGLAAGPATISAQAGGVTGGLTLGVIAWNPAAITAALTDPFTGALSASLSSAVRSRVEAALGQCSSGVTQGNFTTIESCLATLRTEVATATDPTDRALFASLALFLEHIDRQFDT